MGNFVLQEFKTRLLSNLFFPTQFVYHCPTCLNKLLSEGMKT